MCEHHGKTFTRRDVLKQAGIGLTAMAAAQLVGPAAMAALAPANKRTVLQLALVKPSNAAQAAFVARLDDTHAVRDGVKEYLLWPGDKQKLDELGIDYEITVADLEAHERRAARLEASPGPRIAPPGFAPRTDYRRLADYESEILALADMYPAIARSFTLNQTSFEGRNVFGIEVAGNVGAVDGRPTVLIDGIHHAREWPAGEYPMMFAHHLLTGYGTDPRITALLDSCRVAIVPIMNVDGFYYARESIIPDNPNLAAVAGGTGRYWRKNRRVSPVNMPHPRNNPAAYGVDPNRNYPLNWGRTTGELIVNQFVPVLSTTSPNPTDQTYFGTSPLSEPETRNIADFILSRNLTAYVSNHTYQGLVLRPWGDTADRPYDFDLLFSLGARMSNVLGYTNQTGLDLYPTTGAASDWSYAATAAISYTFEHGLTGFHPTYNGTDGPGRNWPKVMEAYTILAEAGADPLQHSVVRGSVVDVAGNPVTANLTIHKEFYTPIHPPGPDGLGALTSPDTRNPTNPSFHEIQEIATTPASDGTFEWHVGPSTRPMPAVDGQTESYPLTISVDGLGSVTQQVTVARGEQVDLGTVVLGG